MKETVETILLVDDTPANLSVLFDYLEKVGYNVLVVTSGTAALESVKRRRPDLILLDIMMPGLDGFETCRRLKEDITTKSIPVIFMTALSDAVNEVEGFSVGAVDYITKPIQIERVLVRIKTHLTIHRLQRELEEKNKQLQEALENIKMLEGYLPICANCKKVRDDEGYWQQIEAYIETKVDVEFTHSICPDCMKGLYPDFSNHSEWQK